METRNYLTTESINNGNFSETTKKIFNYWKNNCSRYISIEEANNLLNTVINNITFDIENINDNMTLKEAIKCSKFRLCSIFDNDFEDAPELENMTLKQIHHELACDKYWDLFRDIDTAVRSQVKYLVAIANGNFKNMAADEIYCKTRLW